MPSEPFPYQRIVGKYSEDRLAKFIRFQSRIRSLYNLRFSFQRVMQTLEASLTLAMQTMAGASHSLYVSTTALSAVL